MNPGARVWAMNCWMRFAARYACWNPTRNAGRFITATFALLTRRFPCQLFYRVEGDRVIVFRILHATETPVANEKLRPRDAGTAEGLCVAARAGIFCRVLNNAELNRVMTENQRSHPFFVFATRHYLHVVFLRTPHLKGDLYFCDGNLLFSQVNGQPVENPLHRVGFRSSLVKFQSSASDECVQQMWLAL